MLRPVSIRLAIAGSAVLAFAIIPLALIACDDEGLDVVKAPATGADSGPDGTVGTQPDTGTPPQNDGSTPGKDAGPDAPAINWGACPANASPTSTCNPVNGSGCDLSGGGTCDYNPTDNNFICYGNELSNTGQICEACDFAAKKACKPGTTCHPGYSVCARYCCSDADCMGHGTCLMAPFDPNLIGVCDDEAAACNATDGGSDGSSDAPTD